MSRVGSDVLRQFNDVFTKASSVILYNPIKKEEV
jgi:hypothetical protein